MHLALSVINEAGICVVPPYPTTVQLSSALLHLRSLPDGTSELATAPEMSKHLSWIIAQPNHGLLCLSSHISYTVTLRGACPWVTGPRISIRCRAEWFTVYHMTRPTQIEKGKLSQLDSLFSKRKKGNTKKLMVKDCHV